MSEPATRFATVVVDPPWDHSDGTGLVINVGMSDQPHPSGGYVTKPPYESMTLDEIKALPVAALTDDDAHLYLWTTNRYLRDVWDVAEAWGFRGVCIIVWAKAYMGALGGGAWQSNTEFCLFARRGNLQTTGKARGRWYAWPRSRGAAVGLNQRRGTDGHSRKPDAFLDLVEQVSPGPYAELFARRARFGWEYPIGNQALGGVAA